MRLCTMGLKEGFLNNLLFCWRERIYRQVLLDLCVVHLLFGHEFPENISLPLMYVTATSKRRPNIKPQIITSTLLSRQTGIRLDSWVLPGVMPLYQDRGRSSFPRSRPRSLAILIASLRKIMLVWYLTCLCDVLPRCWMR